MSTTVFHDTIAKFREEPSAAQTAPAVIATLTEGRASLTGGPFTWQADLPPVVGGGNTAPSPTAYLLGALAGCAVVFIHDTLAPQLGVQLDGVSAVARCRSDLRGLLGMDGANPSLADLAIEITIDSPDPSERIDELHQAWLQRCPIYLALANPGHVDVTWASTRVDT